MYAWVDLIPPKYHLVSDIYAKSPSFAPRSFIKSAGKYILLSVSSTTLIISPSNVILLPAFSLTSDPLKNCGPSLIVQSVNPLICS